MAPKSVQGDGTEGRTPLIKGMFVNSHVKKLRGEKGDAAVVELERRFGRKVGFRNLDGIPVADEVRIIEIVLDLLGDSPNDPTERAFEAGRLHFRNFAGTHLGRFVMSATPKTSDGFKKLMSRANYIARHVFKYTDFKSVPAGERSIVITMNNNDYPIQHFRGFFHEWMVYWRLAGVAVGAEETSPRRYEYSLSWK